MPKRSELESIAVLFIWCLALLLCTAGSVFLYLNRATFAPGDPLSHIAGDILSVGSVTAGALIVRKYPGHLVGWLFCYLALPIAVYSFTSEYAIFGLVVSSQELPGAAFCAWLQIWVLYLTFPGYLAIPYLLFPDGRLLSPRWRIVVWLAIASTVLTVASQIFIPGEIEIFRSFGSVMLPVANPTGIEIRRSFFEAFEGLGWLVGISTLLASIFALVLRFRRSSGVTRRQLKWLAYLSGVFTMGIMVSIFLPGELNSIVGTILFAGLLVSFPAGVGVAILRHQLYDIDLLIKRTLVYSLLTGALTLLYFVSVLLLQRIFPAQSQLSIVLSTLFIAALFNPLRNRIQIGIDRRFYRQKYDAEKILTAFSESIRDEIELERISELLVIVAQETIQPEHVSLWMRDKV